MIDRDRRLPGFVIIGSMKSATTSLFTWLGGLEGVYTAAFKEPDFFSREDRWSRGVDWYASIFRQAPEGALIGEASVSYTDPAVAKVASERMAHVLPKARLIFSMRHPVARLRSHYRHEVQRSRETRTFAEAVSSPDNPYVRFSLYNQALQPFIDRFGHDRLLVVRMEDVVGDPHPGWGQILNHLGLRQSARPEEIINVSANKDQFTPALLWLWERGLDRPLRRLPVGLRRRGRRLLLRSPDSFKKLLASANEDPPPEVITTLRGDTADLESVLGGDNLWEWA